MIEKETIDRWTNYETADTEEAQETHHAIRGALEEGGLRGVSDGLSFDTLLQGSYRNQTMVYGAGDVDILVIRTDTWHGDFTGVPEHAHSNAPSNNPRRAFDEHAEGVYRTLQYIYGANNVTRGEKAIEVDSNDLPLGADVVPCLAHRKFWPRQPGNHMPGIMFWAMDGEQVVNYPRRHRQQGIQRQRWTKGRYKPTIRIFKNLRNTLVNMNRIEKEDASSYFIECLLSNVPVQIVRHTDTRTRVMKIIDFLDEQAEDGFPEFNTQHGLRPLFGETNTQWDKPSARTFIRESRRYLE